MRPPLVHHKTTRTISNPVACTTFALRYVPLGAQRHSHLLVINSRVGEGRQTRYLAARHLQERSSPQTVHQRRVEVVSDVLIDEVLPHPVPVEGHEPAVVDEILRLSTVVQRGEVGSRSFFCVRTRTNNRGLQPRANLAVSSSCLSNLPSYHCLPTPALPPCCK